jgi:aromatic ring hydroxylase
MRHVRRATYVEMLRAGLRAAEVDHRTTPGGSCALGASAHLRAFVAMISERVVSLMEHIGTSALVFQPTMEDMSAAALRPYIDLYGRGKDTSARDRIRLCKLAWELTGDSFGGRQQLYERLHSGDPAVVIAAAYRQYDIARDVEMVERLLSLDDSAVDARTAGAGRPVAASRSPPGTTALRLRRLVRNGGRTYRIVSCVTESDPRIGASRSAGRH